MRPKSRSSITSSCVYIQPLHLEESSMSLSFSLYRLSALQRCFSPVTYLHNRAHLFISQESGENAIAHHPVAPRIAVQSSQQRLWLNIHH